MVAGVIKPEPDPDAFESFDSSILVHLQLIVKSSYDIPVSTGTCADLIEFEADIRNGIGDQVCWPVIQGRTRP